MTTAHLGLSGPLITFALQQCWAMEPGFHRKMFDVLFRHAAGVKLDDDAITAATGRSDVSAPASMRIEHGCAIVPIHGVIAHRASSVGRISSSVGTSVEHIRADLRAAVASPAKTIVLFVDSPGGSVAGIDDLATDIRAAREEKKVVAITDGMMASAAYWLASQAHQVFASGSAMVGSIGVIASFLDNHRALANQGIDPVVVKSTPGKGGVQSNGTFSDSDRADVQREVNAFHAMFLEAVSRGRGISLEAAQQLGDGRMYPGAEALRMGFVDGIGTLDAVVGGSLQPARPSTKRRVAAVADVADPVRSPDASASDEAAGVKSAGSADLEQERRWQADADLRAEFSDDREAFLSYERAVARGCYVPPGAAQQEGQSPRREPDAGDGAKWEAEWQADAYLRAEFRDDLGSFIAFRRAEAGGRVG